MLTNASRRGVGKAGIDQGQDSTSFEEPSVRYTTLRR
jgi:hypothetical protein